MTDLSPFLSLYQSGHALVCLSKSAATHPITYSLAGRLVLSDGWLVLTVPASLVQGAYSALHETGLELPKQMSIPVMTPQELEHIGGADKVTERGKQYHYSVGHMRSHEPGNDFSKVWYMKILSPELKKLRHSYGLGHYPKGESFQLQIGYRRTGVLLPNEMSKVAACMQDPDWNEYDLEAVKRAYEEKGPKTVAIDLDGTLAEYDGWQGEEHFGKVRSGAKQALLGFKAKGYRIIIHTVRGNTKLIRKWLEDNDLPFDYINENPDQPPGSSDKLLADVYIDDKAVEALSPWKEISEDVNRRLKKAKEEVKMQPTIYVVRHGKTEMNSDSADGKDRIRGWIDVPLDVEGKEQAVKLGEFFKDKGIIRIYSANLVRALETAQAISAATGAPIDEPSIDFRPWNLGIFQGEESKKVHPEIARIAKNDPTTPVPRGESFDSFKDRYLGRLRRLMSASLDGQSPIVVSTHFRCLKLTMGWIAGKNGAIDMDLFLSKGPETGAILVLTFDEGDGWTQELLTQENLG